MKKTLLFLIILIIIGSGSYYYYQKIYLPSQKPTLEIEKNKATISEYYIYGTHFNMTGIIKSINANFKNANLVLWNTKTGKIKKYPINYKKNVTTVKFNLSDEINNGLYLDNIEEGNYKLYLRFSYQNNSKNNKDKTYKYYPIDNTTTYKNTTYHTLNKYNNILLIKTNKETMSFNIKKDDNKSYDVVLDPSCGGIDKGVIANGTNEATVTLSIAEKVKELLEKKKIKVKLTRNKDSLSETDYFDEYNDGGRAVISHEINAKYLFSFQVNSNKNSSNGGFGIYTADGINYDFSAKLVESIISKTNLKTSTVTNHRIDYGIYTHNFTKSEIAENMAYYDQKGYKHYNVTTKSNYMYMIRESGGIITGAYVDDSNPEKIGVNKFYNSNIGAEAYVVELGYLTNKNDFNAMTTNKDAYAEAISTAIIEELKY
ncbi:MAG: N-acetylmuramoyl-L-alanine amidase [Bacilli bacterium]|nr:N-acetylmuramoyl-L-alanine amidase [Bacilli bacterium]